MSRNLNGLGGESEAEGSTHGWSDQGWSTNPRPSISSSEDIDLHHQATPYTTSQAQFQQSASHRRQPINRNDVHTAGSNIAFDTLSSRPTSVILDVSASPTTDIPSAYPSEGYLNYPRARRKSINKDEAITMDSEDEKEGLYHASGSYDRSSTTKKKRRTSSFSLPTHRRKRHTNPYLPIRYLRSWWGSGTSTSPSTPLSPLRLYTLLAFFTLTLLFSAYKWHQTYQIQLEFSIFSRKWINSEITSIKPLKGCFQPSKMSPHYNLTQHLAPKRQTLSPGVSLRQGMSCYDFSATIQPIQDEPVQELIYHTYWRSDLIPFGKRHASLLTSFLATQPLGFSRLILWTNGVEVVGGNEFVRPFVEDWGDVIEVRQVEMGELTKGTGLEGILGGEGKGKEGEGVWDEKGWVDGDAVRLLVLWHMGGVWLDMDMILTRDLHPLVEQEFVTQWDCYDKPYFSLNGALMHFQKHSPYLCEFFHIMSTSPLPAPNTFTWGSHLYSHLHRSLLHSHLKPFTVLPWCFSDPRNCRADIRFPDPFASDPADWGGKSWEGGGRELLEEKMGFVWTVHLHNQWGKVFWEGGWVERLLVGYEEKVGEIKRYRDAIKGI